MRWIGLTVGLAAALLAGWALLSSFGGSDDVPRATSPSEAAPSQGPEDEIDEASRERLRAILRSGGEGE